MEKKEVSAALVSNNNNNNNSGAVEYLFCRLSNDNIVKVEGPDGFPDDPALLKDPDIWVADSATTMHNTRHKIGMSNVCTESYGIVMGNGQGVQTTKMGNINVTVCDKQGNQDFNVTLTDVAVNPKGPFNLFSTSKLQ